MIRFGTIRRSRSVTVTATRTPPARALTSASTENPKTAKHAAASATNTRPAIARILIGARLITTKLWFRPRARDPATGSRWNRRTHGDSTSSLLFVPSFEGTASLDEVTTGKGRPLTVSELRTPATDDVAGGEMRTA